MGMVILVRAGEFRDASMVVDFFDWSLPSFELKTLARLVGGMLVLVAGIIGLSSLRKKR